MAANRISIDKVFTPRSHEVNNTMYISRRNAELSLLDSISGSMHTFLYGESGNGKTWLYKKVCKSEEIRYVIVNCGKAADDGSIKKAIITACAKAGAAVKTGYTETKAAGIGGTGLAHEGQYRAIHTDPFFQILKSVKRLRKNNTLLVVIDNLEAIIDSQSLMTELGNLILLLDDEEFAKTETKFLIVGVPNEAIRYFSNIKNKTSVANRLEELPRLAGFDFEDVRVFLSRGFNQQLKLRLSPTTINSIALHTKEVTLGIPQRVHEYCKHLAIHIRDNNWEYKNDLLFKANHSWLLSGMRQCYTTIKSNLNSDDTIDGRRNQVIYAIGQNNSHEFSTKKISTFINKNFPNSAPKSDSGIGQILSHLCKGPEPLLRRISHTNTYQILDPKYTMCIRMMLQKWEDEAVTVRNFLLN